MLCLFAKDNRFRANQLCGRSLDEDRCNLQELLSVLGARVARIIDSVGVSLGLGGSCGLSGDRISPHAPIVDAGQATSVRRRRRSSRRARGASPAPRRSPPPSSARRARPPLAAARSPPSTPPRG